MPSASPPRVTLGLMAKYWDPGQVKTRLGRSIGMVRAASLHRLFLIHLCRSLSSFPGRREVCLSPASKRAALHCVLQAEHLDHAWEISGQADGNLGNRMERWFESAFTDVQTPASQAILIGADCPILSASQLEQARDQLHHHDVVLGPANDGGYYLIGLSAPWQLARFQPIFDEIPWSTPQVLSTTRRRLAAAGLSWYELEPLDDIDTLTELDRLRVQLRQAVSKTLAERDVALRNQLRHALETILADPIGPAAAEPPASRPPASEPPASRPAGSGTPTPESSEPS